MGNVNELIGEPLAPERKPSSPKVPLLPLWSLLLLPLELSPDGGRKKREIMVFVVKGGVVVERGGVSEVNAVFFLSLRLLEIS